MDIARGTDMASRVTVSPGDFAALLIPVHRGRAYTSFDRARAPLVAVINESMARQFCPGTTPVGQRGDVFRSGPARDVGRPARGASRGVVRRALRNDATS